MKNRCATCISFSRELLGGFGPTKPGRGICLNPKVTSDYSSDWLKQNVNGCPVDGAYASCDENRGDLEVGEQFGCIHWEQVYEAPPNQV